MSEKEVRAGPSSSMIICRIDTNEKVVKNQKMTRPMRTKNFIDDAKRCVADDDVDGERDGVDGEERCGKNIRRREDETVSDPKKRKVRDAEVRYSEDHAELENEVLIWILKHSSQKPLTPRRPNRLDLIRAPFFRCMKLKTCWE
ncbi:uncharacterized protein LOC142236846 [Haematobia irritans]|uniref:uncharacterized protein LOC142234770 n=1 Tax=Haematobia irritans TaxID=7368 RepID=UPI003F503252